MSAAGLAVVEPASSLRAELAEGIKAAWHKSREHILRLGRLLNEAKAKLAYHEFAAMVETDLPFSMWSAREYMRTARLEVVVQRCGSSHVLPESIEAMSELSRLEPDVVIDAVQSGSIGSWTTPEQARSFTRQCLQPETRETAAAWNAIVETRKQHRPESSKCGAPVPPQGRWATQWPELCHLLIERRKALKIAQEALDDKILCGQGQVSKWEIPHQDDGRIPRADNLMDWVQALGLRIELVAV